MSQHIERRQPSVNEVNEFLEIASDFENPLELIREALSNAYDAKAAQITIRIEQMDDGRIRIILEDDGHGMDDADLATFFDLGNSQKSDGIGYKGHGTKIYYKSDRIAVTTVKDGREYKAVMEQPWEKLNNETLPEYTVESQPTSSSSRTRIEIEGFRSGQGFQQSELTYRRLNHYINWKTIGGSLAHEFDPTTRTMEIHVELDPAFDDTRGPLHQTNHFEFPNSPDVAEDLEDCQDVEHLCKVYPEKELEIDVDGTDVTLQIKGMIGGKAARNQLPTHGRHSTQFGVWLAKDHIKVERINETLSADNEFLHFFFVVNCQALELSANRETIRNKSSAVYQAIKDEVSRFMTRVCEHSWYKDYLKNRQIARRQKAASSQATAIEDRKTQLTLDGQPVPDTVPEVLAKLARYSATADREMQLLDYEPDADANVILATEETLEAAAVTVKLHEFFEAESTPSDIERFVCWTLGDLDVLAELERTGYFGHELAFKTSGAKPHVVLDGREIPIVTLQNQLTSLGTKEE